MTTTITITITLELYCNYNYIGPLIKERYNSNSYISLRQSSQTINSIFPDDGKYVCNITLTEYGIFVVLVKGYNHC